MTNKKESILVAGATGNTGRIIVELLQESDDYRPIAMVRKQDQKKEFEKNGIETILGNLEEDVSNALTQTQVDKVIFAAGSKGKNLIEVDQEGAKRLTDAAEDAGAEKFVMLSSMGADDPSVSDKLKDYLSAKQNADEYLKASDMSYSIVRPGPLTDKEGTGKIQLKEKLGHHGSITRADVAQTLVEVLEDDVKQNQVFEILAGEVPIEKAVRSA